MTRAKFYDVARDTRGQPISGVTVTVYETGTTTLVAGPLYADPAGDSTLSNPFTTTGDGDIEFWLAAPAVVDVRYAKTGLEAETHTVVVNSVAIPATEKGAANGVATLDADGRVPTDQVPGGDDLHNHDGDYSPVNHDHSGTSIPGYYPDASPASPHANDDEFNDGALGVAWTEWDYGNVVTVSEGDGGLKLEFSPMPGGWSWGGVYRAIPTGDWSIVTKIHPFYTPGGSGWAHVALVVYEDATSAAGDFYNFGFEMASNATGQYIVQRWSQWNTHLANVGGLPPAQPIFPYLRLSRVGTTYSYHFGDGVTWLQLHSTTIAITPAHIGLGIGASGNVHGPALGAQFRFWRQSASTAVDTPVLGQVVT